MRRPQGKSMRRVLCVWGLILLSVVALPGAWAADPGGGFGGTGIQPGGIGGTGIHPGGIGGTGITAVGVIQRFGSIYVNGREYMLTPRTRYRVDGISGSAKDLRLGDRVTVQAAADGRPVALEVRVDHAVIGRVTGVDVAARRFTVLGQSIHVGAHVSMALRHSEQLLPFRALQVGDVVSVSGLHQGKAHWLATAITRLYPADAAPSHVPLLLRGRVSALHLDRGTLEVGATRLRVNEAQLRALQVGQSVVIRGVYADGGIRAESVTPAALAAQDIGNRVTLVGYLDREAGRWSSDGVFLEEGAHTLYRNGDAGDMRVGGLVAIAGEVKAPGVIAVERITFQVNPMDFDLPTLPPMASLRPVVVPQPEIERPEISPPEREPLIERPEIPDND